MERIDRVHAHVGAASSAMPAPARASVGVYLSPRDPAVPSSVYESVLSADAVAFVADLAIHFRQEIQELHQRRQMLRNRTEQTLEAFPRFLASTRAIRDDATWQIDALPRVLHDRRVDIGDVSPADRGFLLRSLNSAAQGVQVDFDDGHCPNWKNTVLGHANIMDAVRGTLSVDGEGMREDGALMIVRPRAWNMDEMNMMVNGHVVWGALFDFGLHLFHNGKRLFSNGKGPAIYLSKLEGHLEAALWRKIFVYTEKKLELTHGSIKAIVLIENIFAAFEMEEILYELRHHSAGLNCGMWDYTASIVVNYRHHAGCVLPDRQQYVSMKTPFLRHYMELLIQVCKRRGAPATTGMVPFVLDQLPDDLPRSTAISKASDAKAFEAEAGSDGALVYDLELIEPIQKVFSRTHSSFRLSNVQIGPSVKSFYQEALVILPRGKVMQASVRLNLSVVLHYMLAWFLGRGTVVVNGCVEDSATAEISRAQLWQWIHHEVVLNTSNETTTERVTASLVHEMLLEQAHALQKQDSPLNPRWVIVATNLTFRLITTRTPPSFLTTFLLEQEPLVSSLQ